MHCEPIRDPKRYHCQSTAIQKSHSEKIPTRDMRCGKPSCPCCLTAVISVLPTCSFTVVSSREKFSASVHRSLVMYRKSIASDATSWNGCCVIRITSVGDWVNTCSRRDDECFSSK